MLEVHGKKNGGELGGIPDDEAVPALIPRNDPVGGGVVHHFVSFHEERRRRSRASANVHSRRYDRIEVGGSR